ncbi:hypothetical protein V7112_05320 [Bacillus sp. JJ1566]|uniref:hypothetical protein n=1 Tax=Bacillus sp. JJ1566 TaxID=3122961 RepID=UPI002FFDA83D
MFKLQLEGSFPGRYRVVGDYKGWENPVLIEWITCGHQYSVIAGSVLRGSKCPHCSGKDKKDTTRFIQEVRKLVGDKFTVIGEYVNTHTPVLLQHNSCNNKFPVLRKNFLKDPRCPKCSKKTSKRIRWDTESFSKKVLELEGEEYKVQSTYVDSKTHIDILHVKCGKVSPISPSKFLQGNRCRYCYGSLRIEHEWFLQKVEQLVGKEYRVLSMYQSMHKHVDMEHVTCGHQFPVKPNNFIRLNTRCPNCAGNQKKTTAEFKKEVYCLVGEEYEVLGEYLNTNTPIDIKHVKCGKVYSVTPANFLRERRCALCQGKAAKTIEMFGKEVFDLVGDEYAVLGGYVDSNTKIEMKHHSCGYTFSIVPHSFLSGTRCPACNINKGQKRIVDHLKNRNLPFEVEYKIPCRLRLDVAVLDPKHPGKLLAVFEFQGPQHYQPIGFFGGREKFRRQIKNDQKKRLYCMKNDIRLIIIPYWEYDQIEKIIDKHI